MNKIRHMLINRIYNCRELQISYYSTVVTFCFRHLSWFTLSVHYLIYLYSHTYIHYFTPLLFLFISTPNQLLSSHKFIHFINSTMDFNSAYTRYHAQIQRVGRNIHRNIDHTQDDNPPTLPPDNGSDMIKVLRYVTNLIVLQDNRSTLSTPRHENFPSRLSI